MHDAFFLILGIVLSFIFVKYALPSHKIIRVIPNIDNYKDIEYIDENDIVYKYDIEEIK